MFIDLAARAALFHTSTNTAYADLIIDGHRETWPVRGARFRAWLRQLSYEATALFRATQHLIPRSRPLFAELHQLTFQRPLAFQPASDHGLRDP